jgi:hypothetical protein
MKILKFKKLWEFCLKSQPHIKDEKHMMIEENSENCNSSVCTMYTEEKGYTPCAQGPHIGNGSGTYDLLGESTSYQRI